MDRGTENGEEPQATTGSVHQRRSKDTHSHIRFTLVGELATNLSMHL